MIPFRDIGLAKVELKAFDLLITMKVQVSSADQYQIRRNRMQSQKSDFRSITFCGVPAIRLCTCRRSKQA